MGLDMYLNKKTYLYRLDRKNSIIIVPNSNIKPERVQEIEEEVGYWRKANAIHKWFVDNCQDGEDKCQKTDLKIEDLQKLLDICKEIQADNSKAPTLLPTSEGFFFGGTEYNQYYFDDIQHTIDILEPLIQENNNNDYYYQASW